MKTYKYKIAHFTPDGIFLWSKEHTIKGKNVVDAKMELTKSMDAKGYFINVDYKISYFEEVQNES